MAQRSLPLDPAGPPTLESGRLFLRALCLDDQDAIWQYASDPEVTRYTLFDFHQSPKQTREWLQFVIDAYARCDTAVWAIVVKDSRQVAGTCGIRNFDPTAARVEMGYALARRYWGMGVATEAVRVMLPCCFGSLGLNRVEAKCVPEHVASRRVLEKAGFQFEGILREDEYFKGRFQDLALYSCLRRDWAGSPAPLR